MNHSEPLHPRAALRGLTMPRCPIVSVAVGSITAERWDDWLQAEGFPKLEEIGRGNLDRGYDMPVAAAPDRSDKTAYDIARRWAEWLRSKA
jgi:hypothetical protein